MASKKEKLTTSAQKYANKGQFDKAIAEYQKILKTDSGDIRTCLKIGDLYTRMGARSEATNTYLKVAEQYKKAGFHLKAVAVYKQIIKLDPLMTSVYTLLGDAYVSLGLTSEALIQFEQLTDLAARQNKRAVLNEALHRILALDSANVPAMLRLAEQSLADGDEKGGVSWFSRACEQLEAQERVEDYLKVAEQLLIRAPDRIDIAQTSARLYLERQQPKRALAKLQICFSHDRHNVEVLDLLAQAFVQLAQIPKALSVYGEVLSILKRAGRMADMQAYARRMLALDSENVSAQAALATTSESGGEASQKRVEGGVSVSSTSAASDMSMAVGKLLEEVDVLIRYNQVERAAAHFDKIFVLDYYNLEAREKYHEYLVSIDDIQGAKDQLFVLVDAFAQTQPEAAVYYLHQILRLDPYSRRARKKTDEIGGVLPEGLPPLDDDVEMVDSGLLDVAEVDVSLEDNEVSGRADKTGELDIDDIPYIDDTEALVEESGLAILEAADDGASVVPPSPQTLPLPKPSFPPSRPGTEVKSTGLPLPKPSMIPAAGPSVPPPVPPSQMTSDASSPNVAQAHVELSEEIEEIVFFLDQGLTEEARQIFDSLRTRYPDAPQLEDLKQRFGDAEAEKMPDDSSVTTDHDIALSELSEALSLDDISEDQAQVGVDEVFSKFKAGVEEQISKADFNTHFDLGQAYKDMGLWDDAIGEFRLAAGDATRRVTAEMMVGMCHMGAGRIEEARTVYDVILETDGLTESEKLAAMYEKGKICEAVGDVDGALDLYNDILLEDPGFADVVDRIDTLEG